MISTPPAKPRVELWQWLVPAAQVACVVLLTAWLALGLPIGIPGQWAWHVHDHPVSAAALVRAIALAAVIVALGVHGLRRIRRKRRSQAPIVWGYIILVFSLQLAIASLAPQAGFFLVASTGSRIAVEYFTVAGDIIDPWAYCRTYASTQRQGHHVGTHPPGAVLTYWIIRRLYESPLFPAKTFDALTERVIGGTREMVALAAHSYPEVQLSPGEVGQALFTNLVFGACGALTVVPLYWLASRAASKSTGLIACGLFALTPAPVLFFQGLDALVLLLSLTGLALGYAAITRQHISAGLLCGLTLGLLCTITFGALAALVLVLGVAAAFIRRLPPSLRHRGWMCVAVGAVGAMIVLGTLHVVCDGKLHVIFAQAMAIHRELTWEKFGRSYHTWVGLNLVEFACFLGLPTTIAVIRAAGLSIKRLAMTTETELIGLVALSVLLILDISGSVRAEVGRLWMFLMPPLVLVAGDWLRRALIQQPTSALVMVALAAGQVIIMGIRLTPVVLPF